MRNERRRLIDELQMERQKTSNRCLHIDYYMCVYRVVFWTILSSETRQNDDARTIIATATAINDNTYRFDCSFIIYDHLISFKLVIKEHDRRRT